MQNNQFFSFPGMQQMPIKAANSTQKLPPNSIKIPENSNIFPTSSIQSISQNSQNQNQETDYLTLKQENQALKQKLEYIQNLIDNSKQFENPINIIDVKAFLKKNSQIFCDLVDELFQEKRMQSKENVPPSLNTNANQNFLLDKIKELEEKNEVNLKELTQLRESNKKLKEDVSKKDFFREYDFMIKEVEGLRKQNMNLSETIKKLQSK